MKKLIFLFVVLGFASFLSAQQMSVSAGAVVALPMSTLGDASSLGLGGVAQFEYKLDPVVLTGSSGYLNFLGKSGNGFSASIIPIVVGAKYPFGGGLYAQAETGLHMISQTFKVLGYSFSSSSTEFGFHGGVGYEMGDLDLGAKYSSYASGWSSVNVSVKYKFGL
jgi:hypothetical protein